MDEPLESKPPRERRRRGQRRRPATAPDEPADGVEPADEPETTARRDDLRRGFAASYPASTELDELLRAFWAGRYAEVRPAAERLSQDAERAAVRRAAADLRARLEPGRLSTYLFLLPVGLLLWLVGHYLLGH